MVVDATITQDRRRLTLLLVVKASTNESHSKQLGESFVRILKTLSQDDAPGKSVGRGTYDYVVYVYFPNAELVVLGAKSRVSDRIRWS